MNINTVIIGSGIAGMTAAIYLKRANIDFVIIEESAPGGQLLKTSIIENYPGYINIDGPEFAMNIYKQVKNMDINYIYDKVIEIKNLDEKKIIKTNTKEIECKNIIIATGRNSRKLGILSEDKFIGRGVSYCALCDGNLYKNKNVIVVGAGNSAFEEALYLSNICNEVTILVRSNKFRADDILIEKVKNKSNIKILINKEIKEFIGTNKLEKVILNDDSEYLTDGVFIYIGQVTNTDSYKNLNITNENNYINVNKNMETNIEGIYACGDCINKNLYQLVTATGEAAIAANQIIKKENM